MPRRIASVLAALAATAACGVLAPLSATVGLAAPAAAADEPAGSTEPLQVSIDSLTPGVVPRSGPIRISGEVTNLDDETWTTVKLYSVLSATPMTTAAELSAAIELPADGYVGDRIVEEDASTTIDEIAPGDTVPFSFEVARSQLRTPSGERISDPGVYWFGVHALGQGPDGRDETADGRARTFLPLVARGTTPLPTSVVVPLRRQLTYAADGALADLDDWVRVLESGGRLSSLVDLGLAGGSRAVTYLVDPALVSAVQQLAAGNPPRSLAATPRDGQDGDGGDSGDGGDDGGSPSPSASPADGATATQDAEVAGADGEDGAVTAAQLDALTLRAQAAATDWLERLGRALPGHEVLALPYGDVDVAAAADHDPEAYAAARARTGGELAAGPGGELVPVQPAVASPGGYLDDAALDLVDPADTVLVSDAMFDETTGTDPDASGEPAQVPTVADDGGHRIVVTSQASTTGPGPGEARSPLSLRQEILAQAALRADADDPQPLVVVLPGDWNPVSTSGFFSGFDVDWLDLSSVGEVATGPATTISLDQLDYPRSQDRTELGPESFRAADDLRDAGTMLQNLLTRNQTIGATLADQAMTTLSYTARAQPTAARTSAQASTQWVREQLAKVHIEAPRAVTMTGTSGRFSATVTNDLDQPVTIALASVVTEGIEITRPERVRVPRARDGSPGRTRVLLTAEAPSSGVHRVSIRLTDTDGTPLGDADTLTIRSLQVSQVIWVFLAAAGALLFGAIGFRLYRRLRGARAARAAERRGPGPTSASASSQHSPEVSPEPEPAAERR